MKLIVGLGNPGVEYLNTRHNIGFYFIEAYTISLDLNWKEKFNGMYIKTKIHDEDVIFLKPLTYMNLSGECVKKYVDYYKISPEDILVIHDDLDMENFRVKLKKNGSSGGHNGIKNIINCLGTENFKRLKIGIGKNVQYDTIDYVLSKFSKEELAELKKIEDYVSNIIDDYFLLAFGDLMSKYNRRYHE